MLAPITDAGVAVVADFLHANLNSLFVVDLIPRDVGAVEGGRAIAEVITAD
jgi:hypothetical protein